ncbi:hypothetical protein QQZ08_001898 [Neonectria magnoliae]|uniref:Uncharacterized protein n=1 Tax=Neonectria magnoliae TaxID=2732573 RepID=A0ABR1IDR3_9HYPO
MSSFNPTIPELESIQKRISESLQEIQKQEEEYQYTTVLIEQASKSDREHMSRTASSSRKRRGKDDVLDIDQNLQFLRSRLLQIREAIQLQYTKLNELQSQERNMKERQFQA